MQIFLEVGKNFPGRALPDASAPATVLA